MAAGRPREFDVERALDDAMDLFWSQGYRRTTTRDLEARLGIGQSSLYKAFGSKDALLDAVVERYQGLVDARLLDPLAAGDHGLEALDRFLADLAEWLGGEDGRGCLIGRLMGEGTGRSASIAPRLDHYRERLGDSITSALERAAAAGEIDADTVSSRTGVLVGTVLGLNLALMAGYPPQARRALVDQVREEVARWRLA